MILLKVEYLHTNITFKRTCSVVKRYFLNYLDTILDNTWSFISKLSDLIKNYHKREIITLN